MFRSVFVLCALLALLAIPAGCKSKAPKTDYAQEGYVKARVIRYEVEACGFLLELADDKKSKLAPDKLPEELKKNNQSVWVKYTPLKKQLMGTCMAGTQVEIIDIKPRK